MFNKGKLNYIIASIIVLMVFFFRLRQPDSCSNAWTDRNSCINTRSDAGRSCAHDHHTNPGCCAPCDKSDILPLQCEW